MPGAVMIALLLSVAPPPADALADVRFVEPVVIEDAPVRLLAIGRPDGSLAVGSRRGTVWTWHATARVCAAGSPPALTAPETPPTLSRDAWIAHLAALGIDIGPTFQAISGIAAGPVSVATLDAGVLGRPVGGPFHPALLDAVLQVAGGTLPAEPVLPIGIDRISLHAPLSGDLRVVAVRNGDAVDLMVQDGGSSCRRHQADAGAPPKRQSATNCRHSRVAARRCDLLPRPAARVLHGSARRGQFARGPGPNSSVPHLPSADCLRHQRRHPPVSDPALRCSPALPPPWQWSGRSCAAAASTLRLAPLMRCWTTNSPAPMPNRLSPCVRRVAWCLASLRASHPGTARLSGTVLITGGLGGIGRHTAAWARERGADAVLLAGRAGGVSPSRARRRVLAVDIASPGQCRRCGRRCIDLPPLRTVVHAAGVLRDG